MHHLLPQMSFKALAPLGFEKGPLVARGLLQSCTHQEAREGWYGPLQGALDEVGQAPQELQPLPLDVGIQPLSGFLANQQRVQQWGLHNSPTAPA